MPDQTEHPDAQPEPVLDLTRACEQAGFMLFRNDIRRHVSKYGMGCTDDDLLRWWNNASDAERYYWTDMARPVVHGCAAAILDAGWDVMAGLLGIEGHDSPWKD